MFSTPKLRLLIVAAFICLGLSAMADTINIAVNTGSGSSYRLVTGSITTGSGTVTISITNALSNADVISIAQNISAIYLRVDGYGGGAALDSSSSYDSINLFNHVGKSSGAQNPTAWIVQNNVNGWFGVCTICVIGPQPGPDWTIIGGTVPYGGTAPYLHANGSLNNNDPHNPFLSGVVEFTLTVPGVTADSDILGYYIQFGTTPSPPTTVPDSSSYSLLLLSGLALAGTIVRKVRQP